MRAELQDSRSDYVFVVAHRGDWRHAPENSVAAIKGAADMGVDMVEIDIQRTKDGGFVLMHDESIDRTTEGKGNVADYTVEERSVSACAGRTEVFRTRPYPRWRKP